MAHLTRRRLLAAGGTVVGAVAIGKLVGLERDRAEPPSPELGALTPVDPPALLPPLRFTTADGGTYPLAAAHGKGVVLNFWATWCPPCVAEMPALDALAIRLAPRDIAVLTVSADHGGAPAVQSFYAAHHITHLPLLLDPGDAAVQALGLRGFPTTLIIDRQGRERARLEGAADWASDATIRQIEALCA